MDDIKSTVLHSFSVANESSSDMALKHITTLSTSGFLNRAYLLKIWDTCSMWNILFIFLILINLKSLPLIWHFRILNGISRCTKTQRPKIPINYTQLFQPIITSCRAPLMEIDFQMHKSNSSYFTDIDVARAHLICTLFSTGIEYLRGGSSMFSNISQPIFSCALGAVNCSFKRELKAYEPYELWTRVLSWDEKWIYIVTHFVRKGTVYPKEYSLYPEQKLDDKLLTEFEGEKRAKLQVSLDKLNSHPALIATALSKCVFKTGRLTITPAYMIRNSGFLPTIPNDHPSSRVRTWDDVKVTPDRALEPCKSSDCSINADNEEKDFRIDLIESERARGMEAVKPLQMDPLQALDLEFTGEKKAALGRHADGTGFEGLVPCAIRLSYRVIRNGARDLLEFILPMNKQIHGRSKREKKEN